MLGKFRWAAGIPLAFGMLVFTSNAQAEASDQQAYEAAMKCYVVAGNASGDRKKVGDDAKAASYEAKAHAAFDMAVRFGRALGLSGDQMTHNFEVTQERELRKLIPDAEYNRQAAGVCKALGLL